MVCVGETERQDRTTTTIEGDESTGFMRVRPSRVLEHGIRHLKRDHNTINGQALIGVISILGTHQKANAVVGIEPGIEASLVVG